MKTLRLSADGWLEGVARSPCSHHDERPPESDVCLFVVHAISLPPGEFGGDDVAQFFGGTLNCASHPYYAGLKNMRVSAHFFIRRDGCIVQFVSCLRRAWHAGESSWRGRHNCNDFSLGVELEGADSIPYQNAQYDSLAQLILAASERYASLQAAGHEHIAPERKTDPGSLFDWDKLFNITGIKYDGRNAGI